jgi:hypothetical protein
MHCNSYEEDELKSLDGCDSSSVGEFLRTNEPPKKSKMIKRLSLQLKKDVTWMSIITCYLFDFASFMIMMTIL